MRAVTCLLLDAADFVNPNGPRQQSNLTDSAFQMSLDAHIVIDDQGRVMFNRTGPIGEIGRKQAA